MDHVPGKDMELVNCSGNCKSSNCTQNGLQRSTVAINLEREEDGKRELTARKKKDVGERVQS
jgi:hypothetical protein